MIRRFTIAAVAALLLPMASYAGNVAGPSASTVGDTALRNNPSGTLLRDSGPSAAISVMDSAFGAKCDGTTDDTTAIAAADASTSNAPLLITGTCYTAKSLTINHAVAFAGGKLKPAASTTITINGTIYASLNDYIFECDLPTTNTPGTTIPCGNGTTLLPNASWVSVAWWGAVANGTTDGMPGIRAAIASRRTIYFPKATYQCQANGTHADVTRGILNSPWPNSVCVQFGSPRNPLTDIRLVSDGANINSVAAAGTGIVYCCDEFAFSHVTGLEVTGFTFTLDTSQYSATTLAGTESSALLMEQVAQASVHQDRFTTNWGGSSRQSTPIAATWLTNSVFDNLYFQTAAVCYDLGNIAGITISNNVAIGAGDDGTTSLAGRGACVNIETDRTFMNANPAENTFTTSENITIGPGNVISNFSAGVFLRAGLKVNIIGNTFTLNSGSATSLLPHPGANTTGSVGGYGVYAHYDTNACCSSSGTPPADIAITGNQFRLNGGTVAGCGVELDGALATGGDLVGPITFSGNIFDQNTNTGVCTYSATGIRAVSLAGNNFPAGAKQTTAIDSNTQTLAGQPTQTRRRQRP